MKSSWLVILVLISLALVATPLADVKAPALISSHMVLQRDAKIHLKGTADPGEQVIVSFRDAEARATADSSGAWAVQIGPFDPGEPSALVIKGKNILTFEDVVVGDLWVASGQSNMEWPLQAAKDAEKEISQANYPGIRSFTVKRAQSFSPLSDVSGTWETCTPDTAGSFSAVGYFFAREVHTQTGVPIGLIHTSWGGTPAEAWTSLKAIQETPSMASLLASYEAALKKNAEPAAKKEEPTYTDPGNKGLAEGFAAPKTSLEGWEEMILPQPWERAGLKIDGAVWFRRDVEIPESWAGKDLTLSLGPIDDFDTTYFNGKQVGAIGPERMNAYATPRKYVIPAADVKAGRAVIAVRAFDNYGDGGFTGRDSDMKLEPSDRSAPLIPLAGPWRYKIELGLPPKPPQAGNYPSTASVLYNAMIAPLVWCPIKGAIWYQGESNAGRAYQYRELFPLMIRDWRRSWGIGDFPFFFVQLANFMERRPEPGDSEWAELREAQTMALKTPATGMAVIIDVGEAKSIHPLNKQDVGKRLALNALARVYGEPVEYAGPMYDHLTVEDGSIRLHFTHAEGLKTPGAAKLVGFAIAGEDKNFVWADARIDGETVVVSSSQVAKPVAVRYAWADNPECNLYNAADLPASPFRTDDWPGITKGRE